MSGVIIKEPFFQTQHVAALCQEDRQFAEIRKQLPQHPAPRLLHYVSEVPEQLDQATFVMEYLDVRWEPFQMVVIHCLGL
jgi:protein-tyrosine phosphatase